MSSLQRKNIVTCIILSFVTCGFYSLYWLYCLVSDINTISEDPNVYKAGSLLDQKMIETGRTAESRPVLYVVLALFCLAIVTYALMQDTINQLAESNINKTSF